MSAHPTVFSNDLADVNIKGQPGRWKSEVSLACWQTMGRVLLKGLVGKGVGQSGWDNSELPSCRKDQFPSLCLSTPCSHLKQSAMQIRGQHLLRRTDQALFRRVPSEDRYDVTWHKC